MRKLFLLILLCLCSPSFADFNTGDTFGKGLVIQANGTTQTGGGRTLNFTSGVTVQPTNGVYQIYNNSMSATNVAAGTLGYHIKYTGATTAGASSSVFEGSNGNIGIGTTTPLGGLTVMNGNVGIGTWVPASSLQIASGQVFIPNGLSGTPALSFGSTSSVGWYKGTNVPWAFHDTGGTELGFGTNGSTPVLMVEGSRSIGFSASGSTGDFVTLSAGLGWQAAGVLKVLTGSSLGTLVASNIGIGTTTPTGSLEIEGGNVGIGTALSNMALSVMNGNVGIGTWKSNAYSLEVITPNSVGGVRIANTNQTGSLFDAHSSGNLDFVINGDGSATTQSCFSDGSTNGCSTAQFYDKGGAAARVVGRFDAATSQTADIIQANNVSGAVMYHVTANGNVGVGTTLSTNMLDIRDGVGIGTTYAGYSSAPANGLIVQGNVGIGTWAPGGALSVLNGNVGFGVTAPSANLEVSTSSTNTTRGIMTSQINSGAQAAEMIFEKARGSVGSLTTVANNDYTGSAIFQNYDGSSFLQNAGFGAKVNGTVTSGSIPTDLFFFTSAATEADPYGHNTVRMLINSTGNVGIGTTVPGQVLDVAGAIRSRGVNAHYFGDDNKASIVASATTTPDITVLTNSVERMRVTNAGNVGIGTTVPSAILGIRSNVSGSDGINIDITSSTAGTGIDSNTVLMLHNDDASLTDSEITPKTTTLVGSVARSAVQSKFGGFSALFNGSTDAITLADSNDWNYGSGDFTIDFWVYATTLKDCQIYNQLQNGSNYIQIYLDHDNSDWLQFIAVSGGVTQADYHTAANIISLNTMTQFEFVRNGTNFYIFKNGTSLSLTVSTAIASNSLPDVSAVLNIGSSNFAGYLDEYRISKGIARDTVNFTPPTSAYGVLISGAYIKLMNVDALKWTITANNNNSDALTFSNGNIGTNDRMTITTAGNVGIGSTNPGQALDVNGTVRALSAGACTTLYKCQGGVDAGVIQTVACVLCPASTCVAMNGCF